MTSKLTLEVNLDDAEVKMNGFINDTVSGFGKASNKVEEYADRLKDAAGALDVLSTKQEEIAKNRFDRRKELMEIEHQLKMERTLAREQSQRRIDEARATGARLADIKKLSDAEIKLGADRERAEAADPYAGVTSSRFIEEEQRRFEVAEAAKAEAAKKAEDEKAEAAKKAEDEKATAARQTTQSILAMNRQLNAEDAARAKSAADAILKQAAAYPKLMIELDRFEKKQKDLLTSGASASDEFVNAYFEVADAVKAADTVVQSMNDEVEKLAQELEAVGDSKGAAELRKRLEDANNELAKFNRGLVLSRTKAKEVVFTFSSVDEEFAKAVKELNRFSLSQERLLSSLSQVERVITNLEKLKKRTPDQEAELQQMIKERDVLQQQVDAAEKLRAIRTKAVEDTFAAKVDKTEDDELAMIEAQNRARGLSVRMAEKASDDQIRANNRLLRSQQKVGKAIIDGGQAMLINTRWANEAFNAAQRFDEGGVGKLTVSVLALIAGFKILNSMYKEAKGNQLGMAEAAGKGSDAFNKQNQAIGTLSSGFASSVRNMNVLDSVVSELGDTWNGLVFNTVLPGNNFLRSTALVTSELARNVLSFGGSVENLSEDWKAYNQEQMRSLVHQQASNEAYILSIKLLGELRSASQAAEMVGVSASANTIDGLAALQEEYRSLSKFIADNPLLGTSENGRQILAETEAELKAILARISSEQPRVIAAGVAALQRELNIGFEESSKLSIMRDSDLQSVDEVVKRVDAVKKALSEVPEGGRDYVSITEYLNNLLDRRIELLKQLEKNKREADLSPWSVSTRDMTAQEKENLSGLTEAQLENDKKFYEQAAKNEGSLKLQEIYLERMRNHEAAILDLRKQNRQLIKDAADTTKEIADIAAGRVQTVEEEINGLTQIDELLQKRALMQEEFGEGSKEDLQALADLSAEYATELANAEAAAQAIQAAINAAAAGGDLGKAEAYTKELERQRQIVEELAKGAKAAANEPAEIQKKAAIEAAKEKKKELDDLKKKRDEIKAIQDQIDNLNKAAAGQMGDELKGTLAVIEALKKELDSAKSLDTATKAFADFKQAQFDQRVKALEDFLQKQQEGGGPTVLQNLANRLNPRDVDREVKRRREEEIARRTEEFANAQGLAMNDKSVLQFQNQIRRQVMGRDAGLERQDVMSDMVSAMVRSAQEQGRISKEAAGAIQKQIDKADEQIDAQLQLTRTIEDFNNLAKGKALKDIAKQAGAPPQPQAPPGAGAGFFSVPSTMQVGPSANPVAALAASSQQSTAVASDGFGVMAETVSKLVEEQSVMSEQIASIVNAVGALVANATRKNAATRQRAFSSIQKP